MEKLTKYEEDLRKSLHEGEYAFREVLKDAFGEMLDAGGVCDETPDELYAFWRVVYAWVDKEKQLDDKANSPTQD